jgi:hypothetical protein
MGKDVEQSATGIISAKRRWNIRAIDVFVVVPPGEPDLTCDSGELPVYLLRGPLEAPFRFIRLR